MTLLALLVYTIFEMLSRCAGRYVSTRMADTLDALPLQSVAEPIPEVLSQFFDEKWEQGKLFELWSEEDEAALLRVLGPYLDGE